MYVAKVYNTRKKESFFRPYITGISRMLLLISARMLNVCSAHFLSRIMLCKVLQQLQDTFDAYYEDKSQDIEINRTVVEQLSPKDPFGGNN